MFNESLKYVKTQSKLINNCLMLALYFRKFRFYGILISNLYSKINKNRYF